MTKTEVTELNRLDQEMLEALRARASAGKRSSARRHKLAMSDFKEIHRKVYRASPVDAFESREILNCLERLENQGGIQQMGRTDKERLELPMNIWVHSPPPPIEPEVTMPPLHEKMSRVAHEWGNRKAKQLTAYVAVNEWFMSDPDLTPAPLCERALEIFGKRKFLTYFPEPEKALREVSFGWLFSDQRYMRDFLDILRSEPPLLTEIYLAKAGKRGYASMDRGDILFVVENYTTCWSMAEALKTLDHGLGHLAWGIGKSFVSSVRSIRPDHGVTAIRYFGDLDASGLAIPLRADKEARAAGLPPVVPAVKLYDALFELGTPLPGKEKPVTRDRAEALAAWLDERHRERAVELLIKGERLAQEWVGLRHLRTANAWQADVR
ncbi:Wadjet anti-phage system protein JetD domain-containing protein [Streptomyces sp. NPDC048281]|uniref:Wadjet anti-phage system protein JetD domain-containing protein n=1 Tax=Streptomyces sp. NPDC048281 TaxID=3154715 RepID=UPI00343C9A4A